MPENVKNESISPLKKFAAAAAITIVSVTGILPFFAKKNQLQPETLKTSPIPDKKQDTILNPSIHEIQGTRKELTDKQIDSTIKSWKKDTQDSWNKRIKEKSVQENPPFKIQK